MVKRPEGVPPSARREQRHRWDEKSAFIAETSGRVSHIVSTELIGDDYARGFQRINIGHVMLHPMPDLFAEDLHCCQMKYI